MTESIIVRINKSTKEKLKRYHVNVSKSVREHLEKEIASLEREELLVMLEESKRALSKISDRDIIQSIRSTRDER